MSRSRPSSNEEYDAERNKQTILTAYCDKIFKLDIVYLPISQGRRTGRSPVLSSDELQVLHMYPKFQHFHF